MSTGFTIHTFKIQNCILSFPAFKISESFFGELRRFVGEILARQLSPSEERGRRKKKKRNGTETELTTAPPLPSLSSFSPPCQNTQVSHTQR